MEVQRQIIERRIYSLELRHKICKEHILEDARLVDLVNKYDLSCHSLIHDWLRKLGYLPGKNRRSGFSYLQQTNITEIFSVFRCRCLAKRHLQLYAL